jgi:hypothetical protein
MARKNRVATGGTVHPISEAPVKNGERFGDVSLSPGRDYLWEHGYKCEETKKWFRRDGLELHPTHWSPLPGDIIKLD